MKCVCLCARVQSNRMRTYATHACTQINRTNVEHKYTRARSTRCRIFIHRLENWVRPERYSNGDNRYSNTPPKSGSSTLRQFPFSFSWFNYYTVVSSCFRCAGDRDLWRSEVWTHVPHETSVQQATKNAVNSREHSFDYDLWRCNETMTLSDRTTGCVYTVYLYRFRNNVTNTTGKTVANTIVGRYHATLRVHLYVHCFFRMSQQVLADTSAAANSAVITRRSYAETNERYVLWHHLHSMRLADIFKRMLCVVSIRFYVCMYIKQSCVYVCSCRQGNHNDVALFAVADK